MAIIRWFRKDKRENAQTAAEILKDMLKQNPDKMFVHDNFIAVYQTSTDKVLFIPGDFRFVTETEANLILQQRLAKLN